MAMSVCHGPAKIYQFPTRVRTFADQPRDQGKPAVALVSLRVGEAALGGSWYHEAAVQEADRAFKR